MLVIVLFAFLAVQEVLRLDYWRSSRTLNWDVEGYYHYLPALFVHGDLCHLGFVGEENRTLHPRGEQTWYGVTHIERTGCDVLKYTCGTALFELPLFLVAHGWMRWSDPMNATGYSPPYQLAVALSSILFVGLGLLLLRRSLLRHLGDRDTAIALLVLALGTNLFFYSTHDSGMSHGYLFFLFAAVIDLTERWHRHPTVRLSALLGLVIGLILLTRPVDVLVAIVPLLWPGSPGADRTRIRTHLLVALAFLALAVVPQVLYWRATTGQFIYYSYGDEGFDFTSPHILQGLFSYKKGWFVYSPLVLLGFIGLVAMWKDPRSRRIAVPLLVFFPIMWYVVFSWALWWYGGGFGCRPLVETLALLALPIGHLARWVRHRPTAVIAMFAMIIIAGIMLNRLQQFQFQQGILHWDSMTSERYWEIFGRRTNDGLRPFP